MVALPGLEGGFGVYPKEWITTVTPRMPLDLLQPDIVFSNIFPGCEYDEIANLTEAAVVGVHSPLWEEIGGGLKVLSVDITAAVDPQNLSRIANTLTDLVGVLNHNGVLPLLINNAQQFSVNGADFDRWLHQFIVDGNDKGQIVIPGLILPNRISGHWAQVHNSMFNRSSLYKAMQSPAEAYGWLENIANTYSNLM